MKLIQKVKKLLTIKIVFGEVNLFKYKGGFAYWV